MKITSQDESHPSFPLVKCCRSGQIVRHSRSKIKHFNFLGIFLRSIQRVLRKWIVEKASQDSTSPKFDLEGPRKSFEKCNHSHFYPWRCLHHHAIVPRKLDSTYLQHNPDQRWSSGHRLNLLQWGFQLRRLLEFVAECRRTNIDQLLKYILTIWVRWSDLVHWR